MQPRYIYRLIVESSRVISMTGPQTQLPVAVRYTHRETAFGDYVALVGLVRVWFLSGSSMLYPVPVPVACTCMFKHTHLLHFDFATNPGPLVKSPHLSGMSPHSRIIFELHARKRKPLINKRANIRASLGPV